MDVANNDHIVEQFLCSDPCCWMIGECHYTKSPLSNPDGAPRPFVCPKARGCACGGGKAADVAGTKDTNPKDAIGTRKVSIGLLPFRVLVRVALAFVEGAGKYGRFNWRPAGVRASVYYDAMQRHAGDWWEGADIDPDSGLHHIDKAIACLMILRDSMLQGNLTDDRPPSGAVSFAEANAHAARLLDLHADKTPYQYTIAATPEGSRRS